MDTSRKAVALRSVENLADAEELRMDASRGAVRSPARA
jgi:hypothetical protein